MPNLQKENSIHGITVRDSKVCYTPLKDKYKVIRNLESPKSLKQTRTFCGMVIIIPPQSTMTLIPIYNLQKNSKKFK